MFALLSHDIDYSLQSRKISIPTTFLNTMEARSDTGCTRLKLIFFTELNGILENES